MHLQSAALYAGDGSNETSNLSRKCSSESDNIFQAVASNAAAMMHSVDFNSSANCSTSASGCSDVVGGVGSGASMLLRRRGKRKKDYPRAWGEPAENMMLKKRVLRVYDGPKQLLKENVMFNTAYEVRMQLENSKNYVTALDMETVNRAEFMHQYMTGSNDEKAVAGAGHGSTALMEFDMKNVDGMKNKKRLLDR